MSVSLVIQHAMRVWLVILSSVACLANRNSHKLYDFREKKKAIGHKMCFVFLYILILKFLLVSSIQRFNVFHPEVL